MQTKVDQTYIDDPLRILRCIRMSCKFGFTISDETYKAMKRNAKRLKIITKERIQAEFNKILMSENAVMGINMLHDIGAMSFIVPEFEKCYGLTQNRYHFGDVAEHTLAVLDYHCKHFDADLTERLACFLHDIGKIMTRSVKDGKVHFYDHEYVGAAIVVDILRELKYDTDTIKKVQFLIRNHMRTKQAGDGAKYMKDKSLHKLLYECKTFEMFKSLMRIIECDNEAHAKDCCIHNQYSELVAKVELEGSHSKMFGYKLPVTGEDIMSVLGLEPGPIIAEINKRLLNQAFIDPEISKERCIKLLPGIRKQAEDALNKK